MDILPPPAQKPLTKKGPSPRLRRTRNLGALVLPGGAAVGSLALLVLTVWFLHWTGMTPLLASISVDFTCGDGTVQLGEECDDGNRVNGDRCSAQCTLEERPTPPVIRIPKAVGPFEGLVQDIFHY